ncbi:hypothetical protein CI109_106584 [Kwoniella shandongensis]|uniref:Uncharacterized protein n=1 Tax=Kwoniella shandongensis TaxID=1734106 RepID=A0A5M6C1K6_9TREE|nr:uncharacterized protein CI109_002766 [Kwoniella shandongensis]KAA5529008.1 hypothetical protein CI109_002766 [Kwoniella shandongensis]
MPSTDYPGFIYALLLAVGGLMGGIRRGSIVSLVAGVGSGAIAAYGANRVSNNNLDVWPSLSISVALLILMSYRFVVTGKFMPAGMVMTLSLLSAIRYAILIA